MNKKRILFCANQAWNIYNFRRGLLKKLVADGYEVIVLAPRDSTVEQLTDIGCIYSHISVSAKGTNPLVDLLFFVKYLYLLRKYSPDIVFNYTIKPNIYGTACAKLLGLPCVAVITGLGYAFIKDGLVGFVARVLYKISLGFADRVLFLNRDDRDCFLKEKLVPMQKVGLLNGEGIDTDEFHPVQPVCNRDEFKFLLVGRLLHDKGVVEYVDAARRLKSKYPHLVFQLLGPATAMNPAAIPSELLDNWVGEGLVEYLGETSDVRRYIAEADCVVLPSYREGVPRSLLEAMSMARPIIATDVPGCREVVQNGVNGFLCEARNSLSLAAAMENIFNAGDSRRCEMGVNGRKMAENLFSEKIVLNFYDELINDIFSANAAKNLLSQH